MAQNEVSLQSRQLCGCSFERVLRALRLVGLVELLAIQKEGQEEVIHCSFCGQEYLLSVEDLQKLIQSMQ